MEQDSSSSFMKAVSSPRLMMVLLIVLGVVLAAATFIENSTSTKMAYAFVYGAKWFELLLFFLVINMTAQLVERNMFTREKLSVALFHLAFVVIIIGAGATRYWGEEGSMRIREGETSNSFTLGNGAQQSLSFGIRLNDFIIDRYPGSSSPSGFKSEVEVLDTDGTKMSFSIYMNNILKYKGYRFYQSSYDDDEMGSILAVSHDPIGIFVTYTGYLLLIVSIILTLLNKHTRFRNITAQAWKSSLRKVSVVAVLLVGLSIQEVDAQKFMFDDKSCNEIGKVLVQDQRGRTKPLYTLSSDILRKVAKDDKLGEYSPMQVFVGLCFDFDYWRTVDMVSVGNDELRRHLDIADDLASYDDFFTPDGAYKLERLVNETYSKSSSQRNKYEKEILKVNERVNVLMMIGDGELFKVLPLRDGTEGWTSLEGALAAAPNADDSLIVAEMTNELLSSLVEYDEAATERVLAKIRDYQETHSDYQLPSASKVNIEVMYGKISAFEKLFPFYFTIGILMVTVLIINVVKGDKKTLSIAEVMSWLLFLGFLLHTISLGMRWYVSGHSPMSNGYETMLFISWVTLCAGFFFKKRSLLALAATAVLGGTTLLVAHMSFMDPTITNLVPVLQSYWLTIHVSTITASYAFLGLGAILGIINLILMSVVTKTNLSSISNAVDELTVVNYKTLTLGLYFLIAGTFIGAVWANESWGRYWGWDPKETWALITIVVYVIVIHTMMIPSLKNVYAFNVISVFAISSVLMTFFGVNYLFSGLHSYSGGTATIVPGFVYVAVVVLLLLAIVAYLGYRRAEKV